MSTKPYAVGNVMIVGAGIAGLSAAIALGKRGIQTTVIDSAGSAEGASIGITHRAVHALEELGILEACMRHGFVLPGTASIFNRILDSAGNPLPVMSIPPSADARLPSAIMLYRPELARILREAASAVGARVRIGVGYRTLEERGDRVAVELSDGERAEFDLVIGADGTYSGVRSLIHGPLQAHYTGIMSLRWILERGPEPSPGFYVRPNNQMLAVGRLPNDWTYVASGVVMENRRVEPAEARQLLDQLLSNYSAPYLVALRKHLDVTQPVIARPYDWILVPSPWHRGRIALIGDAVHSSTAHLSSGGGLALEDAVVLAQELTRTSELPSALDAFMARRMPRAQYVVETAVKLVELERAGAHPASSAQLRGQAVSVLNQPY